MKTWGQLLRWGRRRALSLWAGALVAALPAHAQLAITEMMSAALKTNGMLILTNNSDFWELTNFGSNAMRLVNYEFSDSKEKWQPLPYLTNVDAGESVIFVRISPTANAEQFRDWWGACVASNVQIRFYSKPGFSGDGDGIRVRDSLGNLVDAVDFGPAHRGVSFVYDTNTGAFGTFSASGVGGACQAETAADIGSPGRTPGLVPLRIVEQPTNIVACLGSSVTFKVAAVGIPRPRYQWFFNNDRILFANRESFSIPSIIAGNTGVYHVVITNGLAVVRSSDITLSLYTNSSVPSFVVPPADAKVVVGHAARFSVSVCAFPAASYQWFSNDVPLFGATERTLLVENCTFAMDGAVFKVRAQNSLGTNTASARLHVTTRPDLRFTEVQAFPVTDCDAHHDWFEITNFGTNAVDMLGYHFSDEFSPAGWGTVTQSLVVRPTESVVFAKNPDAKIFIDWWGQDQLPPGLKIVPYSGFSLFRGGDTLYLWPADAQTAEEYLDFLAFEAHFPGISQRFDYDLAPFGSNSVAGQFGAFRALSCGDIGSPGYTTNPPPRLVGVTLDAAGVRVKLRGVEGGRYEFQYTTALGMSARDSSWNSLGTIVASNGLPSLLDGGATNVGQRFYRVLKSP